MEKFSYNSLPDSTDSSPRSREIEFENPPPWEDQQPPQNYKVKFMCSFGGKIQPRSHDNQLSYVGGETKIIAVDRGIRFPAMVSKLSAIVGGEVSGNVTFKYQLPGEELDALISVANDEDLEHMMHEFDRLLHSSSKPPRMRLFLYSASSPSSGFGSECSNQSDRDRFVEALNSVPSRPESEKSVTAPPTDADFLFGSEKGVAPPPPAAAVNEREAAPESPIIGDKRANPAEIQRQLEGFQKLQIMDQEQQQQQEALSMKKSEDSQLNPSGGYFPPLAETLKAPVPQQTNLPAPASFWHHVPGGGIFPATTPPHGLPEQPVYMIHAPSPGAVYHAPPPGVVVTGHGHGSHGYYASVQRMPPDAHRGHMGYNVVQHQIPAGTHAPPPQLPAAYTQVPYDGSGMGKQVYYTTHGGGAMVASPQYHGISVPISGVGELTTVQAGKVGMAMAPNAWQSSDLE